LTTKRPAGTLAYEHYKQTGTIYGMFEGAVQRGKGPPANPMSFEQFLAISRSLPKPVSIVPDATADLGDRLRKLTGRKPIIGIDD
jgi:hypothetical protein